MQRLGCLVVIAACGSPAQPLPKVVSNASPPVAVIADASVIPIDAALPRPTGPLFAIEGNVDGVAGDEKILLAADGTLSVGTTSIHVDFEVSEAFWENQARLEVVDLGNTRRGIFLAVPSFPEGEDPPSRYRVFVLKDGALRLVLDETIGTYGETPLVFPGDGTARYVEDGWGACTRLKMQTKAVRQEVTFKLDAAMTKMSLAGRTDTKSTFTCDELSACPYVYVVDDAGAHLQGEILRNVRGAAAATRQSLAVGTHAGPVKIRIAEEKAEVTFIDELYVEVDGIRIAPTACAEVPAPAYCAADGKHHVLREGDRLDLVFEASGAAILVAGGYYIPTPTAARRSYKD